MLDTVTLCGNTKLSEKRSPNDPVTLVDPEKEVNDDNDDPLGPENIEKAEGQWSWLEDRLNKSRANYLFVAGHFPVYSVGDHGPTKCLVKRLLPLLSKYKVSAYFSGHDHNLQHLKSDTSGWTTDLVVSGAGTTVDNMTPHTNSVPKGSLQYVYPNFDHKASIHEPTDGGYAFVRLDKSNAIVQFIMGNDSATPLYQFQLKPRQIFGKN